MNESSVNIKYKDKPVLLDRIIQDFQKALLKGLPWLDCAFGRSYRLVEHLTDGGKFVYPAVYNSNSEYVSVLPNDNFGNFSWFDIYDPQLVDTMTPGFPKYSTEGALIFWYNLDSIYPDSEFLYTEETKNEILSLITTPGIIRTSGRLTVKAVYERFENIYKGYSIEKIYNDYLYSGQDIQGLDKQFFMHPYAGLRIEFEINTKELC